MKTTCLRCGGQFQTDDSGASPSYCVTCCAFFHLQQQEASKGTRGAHFFADKAAPGKMPQLPVCVLVAGRERCGVCGSVEVHSEYGFSPFGLGAFNRCHTCGVVLNFHADTGE